MRIVFLPGYRYPASLHEPVTSGDLRYTFNLSRALARAGMSVAVLTRKAPAGDEDVQDFDGVRIYRYRSELGSLFSTSFDVSVRRRQHFSRLVRGADIVVANSPLTLEFGVSVPCPLIYVCSGLEDVRNYAWTLRETLQFMGLKLLRDPLKRMTWRRAARVNTTAERENETLVRMGVPAEHVSTIGPGVELERYAPLGGAAVEALRAELTSPHTEPKRIILSVSRFTPAKGLIETLHAYSRLMLTRQDVILVILGVRHSHRSGYFEQVQKTILDLGLGAHVIIRENIPEASLPLYYSVADVTSVFSVGYDPLPTVIIESMSCGTPVVSTDFNTRAQMISDGQTGLLVPERDQKAWVAAVRCLLDDERLAMSIRCAGLAKVRNEFDMNLVARQYVTLFRSL